MDNIGIECAEKTSRAERKTFPQQPGSPAHAVLVLRVMGWWRLPQRESPLLARFRAEARNKQQIFSGVEIAVMGRTILPLGSPTRAGVARGGVASSPESSPWNSVVDKGLIALGED